MKNCHFLLLLLTIAFGSACSTVGKITGDGHNQEWNSNNIPGHTFVSFKDLNGEQKFEFKPAVQHGLKIKYHATIINGRLGIEIRSSSASILKKDIKDNVQDSVLTDITGNTRYYVIINGASASGTFDIIYKAAK